MAQQLPKCSLGRNTTDSDLTERRVFPMLPITMRFLRRLLVCKIGSPQKDRNDNCLAELIHA